MFATTAATLGIDIASEAKRTLVHLDGIGSDLPPTILAWSDTTLLGYAMYTDHPIDTTVGTTRLQQAAGLLVSGWHATSLALVMEGYAQPSTAFTTPRNGPDLAARYPTDPTIREALWITYTNGHDDLALALRPYTQNLGRTVTFDDTHYDTRPIDQLVDYTTPGTIPHLLHTVLTEVEPTPIPKNASIHRCRTVIAGMIHRLGFSVRLDHPDGTTEYPDPLTGRTPT